MTISWPIVRVWIYRELAFEMVKRELLAIHKGSILGYVWLLISPLIQSLAYVIITSGVSKQGVTQSTQQLSWVLIGVGTWQLFSKILGESPTLILSRIDIIKQVYFPLEILPLPRMTSGLISAFFMYGIALLINPIESSMLWRITLLPFVVLLSLLFILSTSWILSVAGVIMRDLRELVNILLTFLIFASPAIFPPNGPSNYLLSQIMELNPITPFIHMTLWCFGASVPELTLLKSLIFLSFAILIGSKILSIAKIKIAEMI